MAFTDVIKTAQQFAGNNSASILTGVGVTGVATTAYLTGKASFEAADLLRVREIEFREQRMSGEKQIDTRREQFELTWKLYIPAAVTGTATIVAIVAANRISSKKAAALTAAYGISERAFEEYKAKVVEKLGETKEQAVRDSIAQDKLNAQPFSDKSIIIGTGEVPVMDAYSGRYFSSTMQTLLSAQNKINHQILTISSVASLSEFYDEIGLTANSNSNEVGFNLNNLVDLSISTGITEEDIPCLVMDFRQAPSMFYGNLHS